MLYRRGNGSPLTGVRVVRDSDIPFQMRDGTISHVIIHYLSFTASNFGAYSNSCDNFAYLIILVYLLWGLLWNDYDYDYCYYCHCYSSLCDYLCIIYH